MSTSKQDSSVFNLKIGVSRMDSPLSSNIGMSGHAGGGGTLAIATQNDETSSENSQTTAAIGNIAAAAAVARMNNQLPSNPPNYEKPTVAVRGIKVKKKERRRQSGRKHLKLKNIVTSPTPAFLQVNDGQSQQDLQTGFGVLSPGIKVTAGETLASAMSMRHQFSPTNKQSQMMFVKQPFESGKGSQFPVTRQSGARPTVMPLHHDEAGQIRSLSSSEQQLAHSTIDNGANRKLAELSFKDSYLGKSRQHSTQSKFLPLANSGEYAFPGSSARGSNSLDRTAIDFVARNSSIQRILQKSMVEALNVTYDKFKRSDHVDTVYRQSVAQPMSPNATRTSFFNKTQKTFQQTMPKLPQLKAELLQSDFDTGGLPNINGSTNTLRSTMRHLLKAQNQKQELEEVKRRSSNQPPSMLSEQRQSPLGYQRILNASQTYSTGFMKKPADVQATKKHGMFQSNPGMTLDVVSSPIPSDFKNQSLLEMNKTTTVPMNTLSPQRRSDFSRTDSNFFKGSGAKKSDLHSYKIEDIDESDFGASVNLLERSFEQRDFVEQAKLMRISLDENRRDRFMNLYEANQREMHKKIRNWGSSPVSKSVNMKRAKRYKQTGHPNIGFMVIQEEDQDQSEEALCLSTTDVRDVTLKSLAKRGLQQSVASIQQSQPKIGSSSPEKNKKQQPPMKIEEIAYIADALIKKIDPVLYECINVPARPLGRLANELPVQLPVQPYIAKPNKVMQEPSITTASEQLAMNEMIMTPTSVKMSSKFLQLPGSSMNVLSIERMKRKSQLEQSRTQVGNEEPLSAALSMDHALSGDFRREIIDDAISSDSSSEGLAGKHSVNFKKDNMSHRPSELDRIDTKAGSFIKIAIQNGKKAVERKHQAGKRKIMQGQSLYGFPSKQTLEKHNETSAQQTLDTSLLSRFKENPAQIGLAMVDQERRDDNIVQAERFQNPALEQHVRFLTGDDETKLGDEFAIFQRDPLVKKPGALYTFQELSDVEMQLMADNANQFDKKVLYYQINKVANCSSVLESRAEHPEYIYYVECAQDTDLPLPVLSHIYANTLNLANYTLSQGHCQALNRAAKYLQRNINRVRLDNCGIDDKEMAQLISAFVQFKDFKSIIYRKNTFNELSLEGLKQLLAKRIPYHLQELRISNCRLNPIVTRELIQAIKAKNQLKSFELAETSLTQEDVEALGEYAKNSRQLEELELSSNGMIPSMIDILMEQMSQNKRLVQLNISYNNMIEGFSGNNMPKVLETEARVKEQLFQFLRTSKKLIHLDLTSTNLSENAILHILPAIKKSLSLQSIHLSGNPGVTETVKTEARQQLKTKMNEKRRQLNLIKFLSPETQNRFQKLWLREAIKIKHISIGKSLVQNGSTDDKFINHGSKMIFMRYLSHKDEIPGSAQWKILTRKQDHCWLCERKMKGYIFWTVPMSHRSRKIMQISNEEKKTIFNALEQPKAETTQIPQRPIAYIPPPQEGQLERRLSKKESQKEESESETDQALRQSQPTSRKDPVICGSFTDWKPRKMVSVFDFLQAKEPNEDKLDYRNVFETLKKTDYLFGEEVNNFEECQSHHLNKIEEKMARREPEIFYDWRMMFEKTLTYKKPFLVNSDVVREDDHYRDIYVAPVFSRSGRQIFCIQPGDTHESMQVYSSIIDFRQEDVPPKHSKSLKRHVVKVFKKPVSVFAAWWTDTENVRDKCLYEHDYCHWKLEKFVKDSEQRNQIEQVIHENFYFLKGCFLEVSSETAWPCLSQLGFASFCQRAGLIDSHHLKLGDLDRFFMAARVEEGAARKQNSLNRFMFFEAVCRAGIQRFYDNGHGECETQALAVERTIETIREAWKVDMWEKWRQDYLYQVPVQEALFANLKGLTVLYKSFLNPMMKSIELADCLYLMVQSTGVGAAQAQFCFGMSKMTTIFEREKKSLESQTQLVFVEFLEFVGRIAFSKFQGSELEEQLDLAQKIEYILDDLLATVNMTRNDRERDEEYSETDESTDNY